MRRDSRRGRHRDARQANTGKRDRIVPGNEAAIGLRNREMEHGTRSQGLNFLDCRVDNFSVIQQEHTDNNGQAIGCCFFEEEGMGQEEYAVNPLHLPCHLNDMGRDAMNLVEFPLALLARSGSEGVQDTGVRGPHPGPRARQVRNSASDRFGLRPVWAADGTGRRGQSSACCN